MMREQEEAFRILESALALASQGVSEAEVALCGGHSGETGFCTDGLVDCREINSEAITVRVVKEGNVVQVGTTDFSREGILEAAEEAQRQVDVLQPSEFERSLPDAQHYTVIEAFDAAAEATRSLERAAMASRAVLKAKERGYRTRGRCVVRRGGMDAGGQVTPYAIANTKGLLAYHPKTRVEYGVEFGDAEGRFGAARFDAHAVASVDPDRIVETALAELESASAFRPVGPGLNKALLGPAAVGELVRFIGLTCGAGMVESGASFLSDRIGSLICSKRVSLRDDFSHPLHRGMPFDLEGVARKPVDIIVEGVAKGPVYSWENAARLEGEATGHRQSQAVVGEYEGARHLVMDGEGAPLEELVQMVELGVYISDLEHVRLVDSQKVRVTGVSRGGVRVVEDGEIVAFGPPLRMECSVIDLLGSVLGSGQPVWSPGGVVPSLVVDGLPLRPTAAF
ncbi:MAG: metallopeptidase TldD-related protein [Myxococcota bacterium]